MLPDPVMETHARDNKSLLITVHNYSTGLASEYNIALSLSLSLYVYIYIHINSHQLTRHALIL